MAKSYVDGFVLVIPKKNRKMYLTMARDGARTWKKFGALDYKECRLDDAKPHFVKLTFAKLTKAKPSEEVWFSYIVFRSKAHRNEVNKKVMAYYDKKYADMKNVPMPFKEDRFSVGGFITEVEI
jgi:uncharacterized protein YbaA (DUF1428 family)